MHRYAPHTANLAALCVLFAVPCGLEPAHSQELSFDKARYALAVAYCRGDVERPISLSADHQIICFDGVIPDDRAHIRKYLRTVFEHTGKVPRGLWMWNPRFYRTAVKTEISYENYPNSQSEVDELAARFRLGPFIYDP
jgi:hypothetical protein